MDRDTSIELLKLMKRIRITEETIAEYYAQGNMRCPTHLCTGQEAVGAAVGLVLKKDDYAVSSHRAHGHYLGKGGSLNAMIAEIYGKKEGCSSGKGGSMHLIDKNVGFKGSTAIVGGTIPVGVGLGLSIMLKKEKRISCIFFGDGATEEGVFYESLNFAVLRKLPVLFVCENNLYSVYSPLCVRQPDNRKITDLAECIGCPAERFDGNDALSVYRATSEAVESIRKGGGPRFIEFTTYRWREHCGPFYDDDLGYRPEGELEKWIERDPIRIFETKLFDEGLITQTEKVAIESNIKKEISEAFNFAENARFPERESMYKEVYRQELK